MSWRDAAVLRPGARPHARPVRRASLLVAAWVFSVVGVERRRSELNLFQNAVLGLIAAGTGRITDLAHRLGLDRELVSYVVRELVDHGLVDDPATGTLGLSAKGRESRRSGRSTEEVQASRLVFVEAVSGTLLRGWTAQFEEVAATPGKGPWYQVELGTRGRPRPTKALARLPAADAAPPSPDAAAVSRLFPANVQGRGAFTPVGVAPMGRRVLLPVEVYAVEAGRGSGWYVTDPLGQGASAELRRMIEGWAADDPRLAHHLKRVFDAARDADQPSDLQARRGAVREEALAGLPVGAERFQGLVEALVSERLEREGAAEDDAPGTDAAVVLCALFRDWASEFPTDSLAATLPALDRPGRTRALRDAAYRTGASTVPLVLETVEAAELHRACRDHDGSLAALALAAILAASGDPAHPLRGACARDPAVLQCILSYQPGEFTDRKDRSVKSLYPLLQCLLEAAPSPA